MSKIYRPSMTADEAFDALENDERYARKIKEFREILTAIDGRVGLVKTQAEAEKMMAQAESTMAQAKADAQTVVDDRLGLLEEKAGFADETDAERAESVDIRKKANARNTSVTAKEQRVNKELDERETAVADREDKVGEREAKTKSDGELVAGQKKTLAAVVKAATDGLKTLC